jgi:N-acetylglutamate synthase-like GNAT family acetyltransferase
MSNIEYQTMFPEPENVDLLVQASALIGFYANQGYMLEQPVKNLQKLAAQKQLALAVTNLGEVVGTAAYTYIYQDKTYEFGAWSVKPDLRNQGIGEAVFKGLLEGSSAPESLIAVCNLNSGPIFKKLGALEIDQQAANQAIFEPCRSCKCIGKTALQELGLGCVDTIYNLGPVAKKIIEG